MRTFLRKSLLVALGLTISLLVAEGALRLLAPSILESVRLNRYVDSERGKFWQYHELLGWSGIPQAEDEFRWVDCRHQVRQNRYGFRGGEHDHARNGARRIVVLGDSFVWGYGVEDDELFTRRMEETAGPGLEVVNLGVSGYGTDQQLLLWNELGHRWSPDEVLLVVTPYTDLFDILFTERYGYPKPRFVRGPEGALHLSNVPVPRKKEGASNEPVEADLGSPSFLYHVTTHSAVASLVVERLSRSPRIRASLERRRVVPPRLPGYGFEYPLFRSNAGAEMDRAWDLLSGLIATLDAQVRSRGARLTVAVAPASIQVYPDLWERFSDRDPEPGATPLDPALPGRRVAEICRDLGVPVIDLLPEVTAAAASRSDLYFPINTHWTREGHRVAARILLAAFVP
jgi:hypothetical protein